MQVHPRVTIACPGRGTRSFRVVFQQLVLGAACLLISVLAHAAPRQGEAQPAQATAADRNLAAANGLLQRGLHEQAAAEYRGFLKGNPDHPQAATARYGLAVCLSRMNDSKGAADELDRVVATPGFQFAPDAGVLLAQCRVALKEYQAAVTAAARVLTDAPDHALADDAALLAAQASAQLGKWKDVATTAGLFDARYKDSPHRTRMLWLGAQADVATKNDASARDRLQSLLNRDDGAPLTARATLLLAQCLHRMGELPAAETQYRAALDAIAVAPVVEGAASPSEGEPDALMGLASVLLQQQQASDAVPFLDRLIDSKVDTADPLRPPALMARARVRFDATSFDAAAQDFSLAAQLDSSLRDQAEYWQAKCDFRMGRFDRAANRLAQAITAFPDSALLPNMSYDHALSLARADNVAAPEALATFHSKYPDQPLAPDALHLASSLEHQRGNYDKSLSLCTDFARAHPVHALSASIAFLGAENLLLLNRTQEAADAYQAYLKNHSNHENAALARFRLAAAQYALDRLDDARPMLEAIAKDAPASANSCQAALMLGDVLFRASDWPGAERAFSQALACPADWLASQVDQILLRVALCQSNQQQHAAAVASLTTLLSDFSGSDLRAQSLYLRGRAHMDVEQVDEAATDFKQVADQHASSPFAALSLERLGAIAMSRGEYAAAADYAARASDAAPSDDEAFMSSVMLTHGLALSLAGQYEPASAALTAFASRFPKHERTAEVQAHLGISLARLGRHADALPPMDAALKAPVQSVPDDLRATLLYERAWCMRSLKKLDEAQAAYVALLEMDSIPPSLRSRALLESSELLTQADQSEDAAQSLREVLTLVDAQPQAVPADIREQTLYRLALWESQAPNDATAADLSERLIKEFPSSPLVGSARQIAAEALARSGKHDRAAVHLSALLDSNPSDGVRAPVLLRLGEARGQMQEWDASRTAYETFLKDYPESDLWFHATFGVGWALENSAKHDQAVEMYRRVTQKHTGPTAARAQFQIGECLYAQKKLDEALGEFMKVDILYDATDWAAAALFEAGRCLQDLQRADDALKQFKTVIQKYPQSSWARMAEQRLAATPASMNAPARPR